MQIPASPHELTTDWLASVLGGQGLGPDGIQSFDVELLGGEQGMTGQLVRLRIRYQDERPAWPGTVIVKFSAAEPGARAVISALGHYEREVRFYESLSARTPVPTPHCYYSHLDSETGFALLVLEELANATCLRLRSLVAPEAMVGTFSQGWPSFLQKLSIPVTPQISEMGDWIGRNLQAAATTLFDSDPRTLIHYDVQADNLFFGEADGEVIFIDWQLATYGRCVLDVAGWIRGQLEPEVRRAAESRLLRLYHNSLVANGVQDYTFEQCRADYRLATVLRPALLASAVGVSEGLQAHPGAFWDTLITRYPD